MACRFLASEVITYMPFMEPLQLMVAGLLKLHVCFSILFDACGYAVMILDAQKPHPRPTLPHQGLGV